MCAMSPVSRARKKNPEPTPQSVNGVFKDVLRDFSSLGADPEPLDVELLTAEVAGQWWDLPAEDGADETPLGLELIAFARRKITPGAAALLASMRVLGETVEEREAAADALETVLGRGIPEPDWAKSLTEVAVGECWRTGDVYGDESSLLCVFGYDERKHGLLALLDFNENGGRARDVVVIESPDEVLAEMREQFEDDPDLVVLEQVSPAKAHQMLADGLAATDALDEPDVSEDYARFRLLALARLRALPQPDASPDPQELSVEERDVVVAEFMAASAGLDDTEATHACARMLVDFGCEHEPVDPLRVGPEKLARFLEAVLDGEVELDEEQEDVLEPVLLAWVAWAAARAGVSEVAVTALLDAIGEYLDEFDRDDSAVGGYLDGTEDLDGPAELAELLDRRMFAIPSVSTELGDDELDLEPTDPEQRRLLVIGEHPEYHEAIAADTFDGKPRMELALKTSVVDQLWDDEPPEAWQAAQRLRDEGLAREEILDRLGRVLGEQLRPTATDEMGFDLDEYRRALDAVN
jgi:hypothetical protein